MTRATWLLVLVGLAIRLFFIFPGPFESKIEFFTNKADLRNYYWPAQAALHGENPYVLWSSGQSGGFRSDMAPLELAIYTATVAIWNDMRAIQVLFAIFDAINIGLLGVLLKQSRLKRPFQVFYALGPLTVYNLVFVPEDKTILLTLTFLIFYLLILPPDHSVTYHVSRSTLRVTPRALVVPIAALLASFKWLSVFYLLPLLLFVSPDLRGFLKHCAVFVIIVALAHLLWIPDWLYMYQFRSGRTGTPMHTAPAVLLNAVGLFDKNLLMIVLVASLLAIYALFWYRRIDIFETMALSMAAGILWTPDMDPVHLSIVVIGFLLITNWASRARCLTIWSLSLWVAAVYAFSTHTGFTRYGLPDLRLVTGLYGSSQMIVLSYVLFIAVFAFYLLDKLRGRAVGRNVLVAKTVE